MHTRKIRKTLVSVAVAAATIVAIAAPAGASTWNAEIVTPSSITLHPNFGSAQTFPLGTPPSTPPPSDCNIGTWSPSTLDVTFDDDNNPTSVSTSDDFQPGAQQIAVLGGWKRIEITDVNFSGDVSVTGSTADITNLTGSAVITFKDCAPGQPVECVIDATVSAPGGTGDVTGVPVTSSSTASISASGDLTTRSGCGLLYIAGLNGATFDFDIHFANLS